ncbi:hypothetical protein SUGI_0011580 [Cryptomeria japonica]|uniref:probable GTP-binding protein OBGM, mitochondrial n=1 Tax=Cryptomeria japonica TaxID=3369 RepID=UPI002408C1CD|nr:probable GTP-binding protein OBGM, mitochondrial [Cryptomeria japonica]GLJ05123.1 hypothetical protein SUGI_0011580 [Cryptomeria japonica]
MWRRHKLFETLCSTKLRWKQRQQPWIAVTASVYSEARTKKGKLAPLQERKMIDRFKVWVKGGQGGGGCTSYMRSRQARHGTPDGGSGGKGGDVILESSAAVWDLSNLQHHLNAKKGGQGFSKNKVGSRGADKVVQVPVGTVVHLVSGMIPSTLQGASTQERFPWEIQSTDLESKEATNGEFQTNKRTRKEALEVSVNREDYDVSADSKNKGSNVELNPIRNVDRTINSNALDDELSSHENVDHSLNSNGSGDDEVTDIDEFSPHSQRNNYKNVPFDGDFEDEEGSEKEEIQYSVAEFVEPGQRLLVACGGIGGQGNLAMGRGSRYQKGKLVDEDDSSETLEDADIELERVTGKGRLRCEHEPGHPGSEAVLILELKSLADIGLVGFPNAGKSTLLGAISRAKPTVGHYAFTTLRPNIGKLEYEDFFKLTVADIPGLIRGAHEDRGLGHAFLRHIERTKALAYVVDLSASLADRKGPQPWDQLRDLVFELEQHQPGLSNRSSLIVANKIDENGAEEVLTELKQRVPSVPIFPVCAVLEEGVPELKIGLRELIEGPKIWKLELSQICVD